MNNYEYIIASLPVLSQDDRSSGRLDVDGILEEISGQLSTSDRKWLDFVLDGFDPDKLDRDFYLRAARSGNGFIKEYFSYDLDVRNAKVSWLNRMLERPEGTDTLVMGEDEPEKFQEVQDVLATDDILARERGLDDLMWRKAEELTLMHVFDLDVILGFATRLKIIDRWLKLDPESGRQLFRKLVEEIRNTR